MLTNFDIENKMHKYEKFMGVYSKNTLPSKRKNGYYIVNMDDDKKGHNGTHWVMMYISSNGSKYFDSFGVPPPHQIYDYMIKPIEMGNIQIQDLNSDCCGWFCMYFIKELNKGRKFNSIYKDFNIGFGLLKNDNIVA